MNTLHPRILVVWLGQAVLVSMLLSAVVGTVDHFLFDIGIETAFASFVILFTVTGLHAVFRYRIWQYELRADTLYLERGVFTRVKTVVPYVRIQHVDSRRGPLERTVGLARTVVFTAGSRGADVTIPGMTPEQSETLQQRLKDLAIEAEGDDAV